MPAPGAERTTPNSKKKKRKNSLDRSKTPTNSTVTTPPPVSTTARTESKKKKKRKNSFSATDDSSLIIKTTETTNNAPTTSTSTKEKTTTPSSSLTTKSTTTTFPPPVSTTPQTESKKKKKRKNSFSAKDDSSLAIKTTETPKNAPSTSATPSSLTKKSTTETFPPPVSTTPKTESKKKKKRKNSFSATDDSSQAITETETTKNAPTTSTSTKEKTTTPSSSLTTTCTTTTFTAPVSTTPKTESKKKKKRKNSFSAKDDSSQEITKTETTNNTPTPTPANTPTTTKKKKAVNTATIPTLLDEEHNKKTRNNIKNKDKKKTASSLVVDNKNRDNENDNDDNSSEKDNESSSSGSGSSSGSDSDSSSDNSDSGDEKSKKKSGSQNINKNENQKKATMDVSVHRVRYLEYHPYPISCIRSITLQNHLNTEQQQKQQSSSYLAISRDNGNIELRSTQEKFRTTSIVYGNGKPVPAMTWVDCHNNYPALIGASHHDGTIFLINYQVGHFTNITASGGGAVFCLESLQHNSAQQSLFAAGCEDGTVRIFRVVVVDDESASSLSLHKLELVSIISSAGGGSPILSLSWRSSNNYNGNNHNNSNEIATVLFAGVADGTIRRFDFPVEIATNTTTTTTTTTTTLAVTNNTQSNPKQKIKSTLRMTVECYGRTIPTRVWALQALQDGTVVSGDSLGHVQFWDGSTGTLLQSFDQTDTKADVLALAVSQDETKVFASGIDSRVVCIERQKSNRGEEAELQQQEQQPWILTSAKRVHTHDVKSLSLCYRYSKSQNRTQELLCSGGIDTKLCIYEIDDAFHRTRPKNIYPWPSKTPISVAKIPKVFMLRRENIIDFYQLSSNDSQQQQQQNTRIVVPTEEGHMGTIEIQKNSNPKTGINNNDTNNKINSNGSNLVCSDIDDNGQFLAVSDVLSSFSLLLFRLDYSTNNDTKSNDILKKKVVIPTKISLQMDTSDNHASSLRYLSVVALKFVNHTTTTHENNNNNVSLIVATSDGNIHILQMPSTTKGSSSVVATLKQTIKGPDHLLQADNNNDVIMNDENENNNNNNNRKTAGLLPIHEIFVSNDGNWFATIRNGFGSHHGRIDVFTTKNQANNSNNSGGSPSSYHHWWTIPTLEASPSAVRFLEEKKNAEESSTVLLGVACINFACYVFQVQEKKLSSWNEKGGSIPISDALPSELTYRQDYPVRICSNPPPTKNTEKDIKKVLLGSFGAFIIMDMNETFPITSCQTIPEKHLRRKKRKRLSSFSDSGNSNYDDSKNNDGEGNNNKTGSSCTVCLRYDSILFMDFIGENEMIVIEQPWLDVMNTFPDALHRKLYGT